MPGPSKPSLQIGRSPIFGRVYLLIAEPDPGWWPEAESFLIVERPTVAARGVRFNVTPMGGSAPSVDSLTWIDWVQEAEQWAQRLLESDVERWLKRAGSAAAWPPPVQFTPAPLADLRQLSLRREFADALTQVTAWTKSDELRRALRGFDGLPSVGEEPLGEG